MSSPLTRSQARTWTLAAQAGALVCVLGAVGAGIVGLPNHKPSASLEQARANALAMANMGSAGTSSDNANDNISDSDTELFTEVDTLGLAQRFALMDNAPVPVQPVVETPVETTDDGDDPQSTDEVESMNIFRRVKYIGFINDARTQHAFIRIDGKQRIVKVGDTARSGDDTLPDLQVIRVTPRHIQLRNGDERATIQLADKSGPSVTMVDGDEIQVAQTNDQPEDGNLLTAEEEAMIESLPPRQQPMARRRLEREKRGLPAENENRRPTPEPLVTIRGGAASGNNQSNVRRRGDN